jgi:hypothetical protein
MVVVNDIVVLVTLQYSSFTGEDARFFDRLNSKSLETACETEILGTPLAWAELTHIANAHALWTVEGSSDMSLAWMRVCMQAYNTSVGVAMCTGKPR